MLNNVRLGISLKRLKISATGVLFHWKCWNKLMLRISSIKKAKIRYGLVFISLWMPKQDRAGDLLHWKCWNKVRLGIYFIENAEVRYGARFILLKRPKKGTAGVYSIEKVEKSYGRDLFYWKYWNEHSWGFISLKMMK